MTDIVIQTTLNGVIVNGLADPPEISIFRVSDNNLEVNAAAMSDVTECGLYKFSFTTGSPGERFMFCVDADPSATGQVDARNYGGSFDNEVSDIWRDRGLDPADAKTVDDNGVADDADIDEDVAAGSGPVIHKDVLTAGDVTTITRTP